MSNRPTESESEKRVSRKAEEGEDLGSLASQPRLLLRRLHGVMAGGGSAEARLSRIVRVVAQNMVAEVCSVYLLRAGGVLELFATEGLKKEAIHQTRLGVGEGLVGLVAERGLPVSLSEATQHPKFVYRPETGEEIYHSFLGVPITRMGRVSGVLTVQNISSRRYLDEEIEALQTIAMVLAELIGSGEFVDPQELSEDRVEAGQPVTLDGLKLAEGAGSGIAVFHRPQVKIEHMIAEDVSFEQDRLDSAVTALASELEEMLNHPDLAHGGEHRDVLETYRMFAYDRGWQERMREAVDSGLTAEAAVDRVRQDNRRRMQLIRDPYIRERVADFDDLAARLIRRIQGRSDERAHLNGPSILIARNLGPAEFLDYDRQHLKGVLLEEGSATSHMSIIARAMGIPVLGRVGALFKHVDPGERIIIDTEHGHAYVRPADDVVEAYKLTIAETAARAAAYEAERDLPAITRDGKRIKLMINAGLLVDLPYLDRTGAEGIGLFRTEFQFMVAPTMPKVAEQAKIYQAALAAAGDRPVVFRTLDVGGDKQVPFLPRDEEENPAMGWRAIRIAIDRPALLRYQLRALFTATSDKTLKVMFPMIAEVAELRSVKKILNKELDRFVKYGNKPPRDIQIGCMLEVPSLAWQIDLLFDEVDFLSIGTNDLMQFFFACDRSSPRLAGRYDLLGPPVLRFLREVFEKGAAAGVPVTLCGEMGGRPLEALALVGIGCKSLSVSPGSIGPVKRMIRSVSTQQVAPFINQLLERPDHSIRDSLKSFALDHNVTI